jgi:hypothetical protein
MNDELWRPQFGQGSVVRKERNPVDRNPVAAVDTEGDEIVC